VEAPSILSNKQGKRTKIYVNRKQVACKGDGRGGKKTRKDLDDQCRQKLGKSYEVKNSLLWEKGKGRMALGKKREKKDSESKA